LVLALSESKDAATVKILQAEQKALGAQLRAVVITDYEKLSARARKLKDVLDPDAGSAVRLFRALVADAELNNLDAVLVTGTTVLLDSDHGEALLNTMRAWLAERNLQANIDFTATDEEKIMALTGIGRDWTSRTYVQLLTAMFEQGFTRCLVGTRGIFGEGWDALGLNTLVDLTAVTTSTGVNQLRGRTLRLDPSWDRKVAHNWDVVCVARQFERGDVDLRRFERKHTQYWGVMESDLPTNPVAGSGGPGLIAKGIGHVDRDLAFELSTRPFIEINFEKYSRQLLAQATPQARVRSYDLWAIGQPYENTTQTVTQLETKEIRFATSYSVATALKRLQGEFWLAVGALVFGVVTCCASALTAPMFGGLSVCLLPLTLVATALIGYSVYRVYKVYGNLIRNPVATDTLLDIGKALLVGLRETDLVHKSLTEEAVRIQKSSADRCEVFVEGASPEESQTFINAYSQIFEPIQEPRYLVSRELAEMPDTFWRPFLTVLQKVWGPTLPKMVYHAVPDVLAANKKRAEIFASQWQHYVGGGELVYTRTEAGRKILTEARTQRRPLVKQMAFEIWR